MELSLLILVCIHKSYIVYLEIYVVPIGRGFSFFWSWKSHGKSMLKKRGHPATWLCNGYNRSGASYTSITHDQTERKRTSWVLQTEFRLSFVQALTPDRVQRQATKVVHRHSQSSPLTAIHCSFHIQLHRIITSPTTATTKSKPRIQVELNLVFLLWF